MKEGARKKPRKRVFLHLLLAALAAVVVWGGIAVDQIRQQYGWDFLTAQKYEDTYHFARNYIDQLDYINDMAQNSAHDPNHTNNYFWNLENQSSSVQFTVILHSQRDAVRTNCGITDLGFFNGQEGPYYLYSQPQNLGPESNIPLLQNYFLSNSATYYTRVDFGSAHNDYLYSSYQEFQKLHAGYPYKLAGAIGVCLATLGLFLYLAISYYRRADERPAGHIHKMPLDSLAIVFTAVSGFFFFIVKSSWFLQKYLPVTWALFYLFGMILLYTALWRVKNGTMGTSFFFSRFLLIPSGLLLLLLAAATLIANLFVGFFPYGIGDLLRSGIFTVVVLVDALLLLPFCKYIWDHHQVRRYLHQVSGGDYSATPPKVGRAFRPFLEEIGQIGDGMAVAVAEQVKSQRLKADLITNVSHDLKTPLTSIINYISLLKKQELPGEDTQHYIEVLDEKAQKLKNLTNDLVELSKATSGNITPELIPTDFTEVVLQANGEFVEKFAEKELTVISDLPKDGLLLMLDGRRMGRALENLYQNIYRYALPGTRVYVKLTAEGDQAVFTIKNISKEQLGIGTDELMERFVRGDSSRGTEGSGLGLSIAQSMVVLQGGTFSIDIDGDLFKATISLPLPQEKEPETGK